MKYKVIGMMAVTVLITALSTGCGEVEAPAAEAETVQAEPADAAEAVAEEDTQEPVEAPEEYPISNEDGSYAYQFTFKDDYLSQDFAGIDVLDAAEDYPRERFEEVFLYSRGDYLDNPDVPPDFFDEWGCLCDCSNGKVPEFGYSCIYNKTIDKDVYFSIKDKNYGLAVKWEKGQLSSYTLWDNEIAKIQSERRGYEFAADETDEVLAKNPIMGTYAKEFVDSFDEGLYDFILSTLPDSVNAYSALFHFDNGVMRAKNVDEDGIGFEFMLPHKGRWVYDVIVDKPTGRISSLQYRKPYPGENFYAYPAGVEWDENGPSVTGDPYSGYPEFNDVKTPAPETDEPEPDTEKEQKTEEETGQTEEEKPESTGVVIDEEEFQHGVMMSPKQGTIVSDDFATGVKNSITAQLEGMGVTAASDPSALIFRRKPFRFGTSAEEAANAVINDVMPMYGFDMSGKNYFLSAVEKFDNGYVVTVGWTRWN